jgi:hypothetical protein
MVTGAIAYQVLKQESPQTLEKVVALLKEHPYYESTWEPLLQRPFVPEGERDLYLFMLAAKWADDARGDTDYYPEGSHRDRWHYVNLPFKPEGEPEDVMTTPPDPENNIFTAYKRNLAAVAQDLPLEQRAVALSWVFHLVGDAHQPLHSASLFTSQFRKGDRGATVFFIRPQENRGVIHLYHFWDGLILGTERYQSVRNRAKGLWLCSDLAKSKLTELLETSFEKWVQEESFGAAKKHAYLGGKLEGGATRSEAQVLPAGYAKNAQSVAERRVVLAGYRLAAVLKTAFE